MKRTILAIAAATALTTGTAHAAVIGSTSGPDSSFSINFSFLNAALSDILSLSLDGSTASSGTIVWDSLGSQGGSATSSSTLGVDTSLATFLFAPGNFTAGDDFTLSGVDPDFSGLPSSGITIADLEGVSVTATFSGGDIFSGAFVDDARPGAGLILQSDVAAVPVPAAGVLLLSAFGALGIARRKAA